MVRGARGSWQPPLPSIRRPFPPMRLPLQAAAGRDRVLAIVRHTFGLQAGSTLPAQAGGVVLTSRKPTRLPPVPATVRYVCIV